MLTLFFGYIGMACVGLVYAFQSWYADRKQRRMAAIAGGGRGHVVYDVLMTDANEMTETRHNVSLQGINKEGMGAEGNKGGRGPIYPLPGKHRRNSRHKEKKETGRNARRTHTGDIEKLIFLLQSVIPRPPSASTSIPSIFSIAHFFSTPPS